MSDMPKTLITKLADVMAAVERIPKRGHNSFHNYDYATEGDIAATVRAELAKRHVMLIPAITGMQRDPVGEKGSVLTTLTMEFTFLDGESGESITRPWLGAGTDKEDKGAYKAMTGGEKYFLLKTFLMPTGDDPEAENGHVAHVGPEAATPATSTAPQPRPSSSRPSFAAPIVKASEPQKFQQKVQRISGQAMPHDDAPPLTDADISFKRK